MRTLSLILVTAATMAVAAAPASAQGAASEGSTPPAVTPAPGTGATGRGMPGIYVTPVPQRRAPAGSTGDTQRTTPQHDGSGGCQYVPTKIELIS